MSLNNTPSSERIHIGIFGNRNSGKSSLINSLTGQRLSIVSDTPGTTTDPVIKAMEILPLGPVVIIDTPGIDDIGKLGNLRIEKSYNILNKTDIAILVVDITKGFTNENKNFLKIIKEKKIPYIVVINKTDLKSCPNFDKQIEELQLNSNDIIKVSVLKRENIFELKEKIANILPEEEKQKRIIGDLINPGDLIVLVVPVDNSAPKGRLILPQQQTIRDILDSNAISIVVKETELESTLNKIGCKPSLVITDSQVFEKVSAIIPKTIPLTSFSILFARYKGNLKDTVNGAIELDNLEDGDKILISEGCSHHRQCDDIGSVKLPKWITEYSGKKLDFYFSGGNDFPIDLEKYKIIIHCGGCTLNDKEMKYRIKCANDKHVPITNYGMAIAHMNGILSRSIELFKRIE